MTLASGTMLLADPSGTPITIPSITCDDLSLPVNSSATTIPGWMMSGCSNSTTNTNTGTGGSGGSTSSPNTSTTTQITNNEGGTTGTTSVSTPTGTEASYDNDGTLQSLTYITGDSATGERTSLILQEYYKADTANDRTDNEVMVSLNYTGGTGAGNASPTQLFMPSGSQITVSSVGDVTGQLTISNIQLPDGRELSVNVTMHLGDDGSSDLNLYGNSRDGNGYSFQREVDTLSGSTLEMRGNGSYKSTNVISTSYGNVISRVEVRSSGAVTISLTNTATGERINLVIPERAGTGRVDYVDYSYASRSVEDSNHNAIRLRYTMNEPFTLMDLQTSDTAKSVKWHSLKRSESLEFRENIQIIPGGSEAGFEEILRFDGLHSFRLINGRADMVMDGVEEEMMAGETYYLPVIQESTDTVSLPLGNNNQDGSLYYQNGTWNLQEGWSLVGVPVSDRNLTQEEVGANVIWNYDQTDGWEKDQTILASKEGYWIKMEENTSISLTGESYSLNPEDHTAGWHLLGAGARMESPHELEGIEQIWVYANHQWSRNPDVVYRGQGFWAKIK